MKGRRYMYPLGLVQERVTEDPGQTGVEQKLECID